MNTTQFDLFGDVHGCFHELSELLASLGYSITRHDVPDGEPYFSTTTPPGRTAVFVGDLVDRGPASNEVLRLVMDMHAAGHALCVPGNHDDKLLRLLNGSNVSISAGLELTVAQLATESPDFRERVRTFLAGLPHYLLLDNDQLVVAHGGLSEALQGQQGREVHSFCLYGQTTGQTDQYGLPVRYPWALDYRGSRMVVYGHTPVQAPVWQNNTLNIDTGCVFGGSLTALRYPELTLHSVAAKAQYAVAKRPPVVLQPA